MSDVILRPYQAKLVEAVVADLSQKTGADLGEVVLAACPSAGKTFMSIKVAERMLASGTVKRVLVIAHAMTLLRSQYVRALEKARPRFTFDAYLPRGAAGHLSLGKLTGKMTVALPQSLIRASARQLARYDLVIVDEAHLYYDKPMVQKIIGRTTATRVLLLTGTPAPFVAKGSKLHTVTLLDLYREGFVADPQINHVESRFSVSRRQYNDDGEIKRGVRLTGAQTAQTLERLLAWFRGLDSSGGDRSWRTVLASRAKTMLVCRSQAVARAAAAYFRLRDVPATLSSSDEGDGGAAIDAFKEDPSIHLLIVVRRANLGFDFPGLRCLVDMTGTINIDRIFQMLCRVVRKDGEAKKMFVKLSSADMFEYTHAIMNATLLLGDRSFYETWNGRDLNGVTVPVARELIVGAGVGASSTGDRGRVPVIDGGFSLFGDFFTTRLRAGDPRWAYATIGSVSTLLSGIRHVDPAGRRRRLLAWYRDERRPVPVGHDLYDLQSKLHRVDDDVAKAAAAVGYPSRARLQLTGARFGRLVVIAEEPTKTGPSRWRCLCDCGRNMIAAGNGLKRGKPRSCGCLVKDTRVRGRRVGTAKLSDEQVAAIRMRLAAGATQVEVAKDFQCSQSTISDINRGRSWSAVATSEA